MATPFVRTLDANGDMQFGRGIAGFSTLTQSTAQRLRCELLVILGEWFLDVSAGVPWFQPDGSVIEAILGRRPVNLAYVDATVKAKILSVTGVATLKTFSMDFDNNDRSLTIAASGTDDDGNDFQVTVTP